ncbi:farnesyl-diphosphate synthase [Armillaria nabsnona]|nr:farnesyl-diphosphate synthase [Armillaria nabsnona]
MPADKAVCCARFEGAWKVIKKESLDHTTGEGMPKDVIEWYKTNLDFNVPGGKLNRGMSVVDTADVIKGTRLMNDEYPKGAVLGWGIELLQAFFFVLDDMMDSSIACRGQPCWYRVPKAGQIAINDSFMLEATIYYLKKHFQMMFQTETGQLINLITAPEDEVDLSKFSLKKHSLIVIYKIAYYSFYLPVAFATYIFHYFQVQDDFLGTPKQIGKIGTDIFDNKCSWCVNTALVVCTPEQRLVLDGRKVLREEYVEEEASKSFLDKIYKRTK